MCRLVATVSIILMRINWQISHAARFSGEFRISGWGDFSTRLYAYRIITAQKGAVFIVRYPVCLVFWCQELLMATTLKIT